MDLGTAIIGLVSVAVCALPFILTSTNRSKKEKQSLEGLMKLAKKNDSEISRSDVGGIYVIGVNEVNKSLYYILEFDGIYKEEYINLNMVKSCKTATITRSTSENSKIIDKLFLTLAFKDKSQADITLDFYNVDLQYQLNDELKKMEKWHKIVEKLLDK